MSRRERGMVTAETAMVLPFVVLVAFVLTWVVSLGLTQMRVSDAAREGARVMARGQDADDARRAVRADVPGSTVDVRVAGGRARVTVRFRARLPLVPAVHLDLVGRSVAVVE
ncbi:TadE family protein [Aeromicrobium duanguangcaii]|uniref:Pilus assembly protein n=1 Tax=Aeromicrobium duanguangcaii TaxID=2968086 RepID=A0ABY5KE22_9ACTN|nr:TadE family protein [Aeromicrobium duanguangcaii]MCD9154210.1 pilus assembly protein [Aeromicrobium duanguangcaii]UUI68719.1 pilus assembly protein [Aeromicrobium duanguangcaii]